MSGDHFEWNEATMAKLRSLWAEGLSTAEIGRRMGTSKNSVVGKAHRLNLPSRPTPIPGRPGARSYAVGGQSVLITNMHRAEIKRLAAPLPDDKGWLSTIEIAKRVGLEPRHVARIVGQLIVQGGLPQAANRNSFLNKAHRPGRPTSGTAAVGGVTLPPLAALTAPMPIDLPAPAKTRAAAPKKVPTTSKADGAITALNRPTGPWSNGQPVRYADKFDGVPARRAVEQQPIRAPFETNPSDDAALFDDINVVGTEAFSDEGDAQEAVRRVAFVARVSSPGTCEMPLWGDFERPTHKYCSAKRVLGAPYCEVHCREAFVRVTPAQITARYLARLQCDQVSVMPPIAAAA